MDPNANLQQLRETAKLILEVVDKLGDDDLTAKGNRIAGDAVVLAKLVESLDGWLRSGGFAPHDWDKG